MVIDVYRGLDIFYTDFYINIINLIIFDIFLTMLLYKYYISII